MCRTKHRFLHLFLFILLSIGLSACNQPTEQLLPELEGIEVDIESLMNEYDIESFSMQGMLLILYYDDGTTHKIPITPNMITQVDAELLSTPGTHTITITHGRFTTTLNLTMVYTGLTQQLRLIYHQGLESGLITGTYEEWLESIKGEDGSVFNTGILYERYLVIFRDDFNQILDVQLVYKGYAAFAPDAPHKIGHYFDAWDQLYNNVTEHLDIKPVYKPHVYTIYFQSGWGYVPHMEEVSNPDPIQSTFGDPITLPVVEHEGFKFLGWFDEEGHRVKYTSMPAFEQYGQTELTGKWERLSYDFTLNSFRRLNIINIETGHHHSLGLTDEQRIFTWGRNDEGQLGIGHATAIDGHHEITDTFGFLENEYIQQLSAGENHSLVLTSAGRLFAWGQNNHGQLGNQTNEDSYEPIEITGFFMLHHDEIIIDINSGSHHNLALTSHNRIFSWGYNAYGQIGDNSIESQNIPIDITFNIAMTLHADEGFDPEKITIISAGYMHSMIITNFGRVLTWGNNQYGQLGNGTIENHLIPFEVTYHFHFNESEKPEKVASSNHNLLITNEGRIFVWGNNTKGQLGIQSDLMAFSSLPIEISSTFNLYVCPHNGTKERFVDVSIGNEFSVALTRFGEDRYYHNYLYTWGGNDQYQLGNGTMSSSHIPNLINIYYDMGRHNQDAQIFNISSGYDHTYFIEDRQQLYGWGRNDQGQLLNDDLNQLKTPLHSKIEAYTYEYKDHYYYYEQLNQQHHQIEHGEYGSYYLYENFLEYSDREFTERFEFDWMPGHDLDLYLKWVPREYKITYYELETLDVAELTIGSNGFLKTVDERYFAWGEIHGYTQLLGENTPQTVHRIPIEITDAFDLEPGETLQFFSYYPGALVLSSKGRVFAIGLGISGL